MSRLLSERRGRPQSDREPDVLKLALERGGPQVRQEQAQGILIAALGMLAGHLGYERMT